jgi:hypothetical protein
MGAVAIGAVVVALPGIKTDLADGLQVENSGVAQ